MENKGIVTLEEGWSFLEEKIIRARKMLMGFSCSELFTAQDYMNSYHYTYCLCTQSRPHDYAGQLYKRLTSICEDTVLSVVLPSLITKDGVAFLEELVRIWANFKLMVKFLSRVFGYLEGHYIRARHLPSLTMVSINCFSCQIDRLLFSRIQNAVISMINQKCAGEQVDKELLKSVLIFLVEIGDTSINHYENLEKTATTFYSPSSELHNCSYAEYIQKVHLSQATVDELLQMLQWALLGQHARELAEKQKSEGHDVQELLTEWASFCIEE